VSAGRFSHADDMELGGILTAMVTPFDGDGALDEEASVALIHHLFENGSDGVVLAGTTGESPTLTDEELVRLWELGVAEGDGKLVIAGAGSNDTRHAVELAERATETGVDAILSVCPYYNKPNRRGLIEHYRAVAEATDRPVIVYNIPSRTAIDMPNDLLRELAEIPNIDGVKQARYEDIEAIEGLALLAGNDDTLAEVMDAGGTGGIHVSSHLVGTEMRRIIDEPDNRHEIWASIEDLFKALFIAPSPIGIKAALEMAGRPVGIPRLPLVEASDEEKAVIREALERHGLLARV
jgi:4-hydroxy-tetrahydrodipicolinate synthase